MAYPSSLLVHSCQIETGETLGTADAFGVKPATKTYTTVSCRFIETSGRMQTTDAGEQPFRNQGIVLPAGTIVTEGKTIIGLSTGFARTWKVKGIPRPALLKSTISHIVCDLEAVG